MDNGWPWASKRLGLTYKEIFVVIRVSADGGLNWGIWDEGGEGWLDRT